jgi:tRNA threonylcarbamoyladenosine biosynthesis protein TsaB
MKLLALETSSATGSVALLNGDAVHERSMPVPREQTRRLLPFVDQLLGDAGLSLPELDGVAFGRGPGSFTGLRIAAAIAQGLALSSGLPLLPVSSLAALAQCAWRTERVAESIVCVDAHMGEVYWARYSIRDGLAECVGQEQLGAPERVGVPPAHWTAVGNGFAAHAGALAASTARATRVLAELVPAAQDLFPQASRDLQAGRITPVAAALPAYLRDATAWKR